MFSQVLQSVQDRLVWVLSEGSSGPAASRRVIEIQSLLSALCGLADGTTASNVNMLHQFLQPALQHSVNILGELLKEVQSNFPL